MTRRTLDERKQNVGQQLLAGPNRDEIRTEERVLIPLWHERHLQLRSAARQKDIALADLVSRDISIRPNRSPGQTIRRRYPAVLQIPHIDHRQVALVTLSAQPGIAQADEDSV